MASSSSLLGFSWLRLEAPQGKRRPPSRLSRGFSKASSSSKSSPFFYPLLMAGARRPSCYSSPSVAAARIDVDDDDDGDGALNSAIEKSKEVLARQKNLLHQIVERRRIISSVKVTTADDGKGAISSADNVASLSNQGAMTSNVEVEDIEECNNQINFDTCNQSESESSVADALCLLRKSKQNTDSKPVQLLSKDGDHQVEEKIDKNAEVVSGQGMSSEKRNVASRPLAGVNVMNVILVAAECAPWSKTGGLGDVAGALPKALAKRGHRVMVVVPRYGNYSEPQEIGESKSYRVDGQEMEIRYYHAYLDGVDFVFLDSPIFRHRENCIYGGERVDVLKRMILFCKAAVEVPWHVPCGGVCYGDGNLVFIANDWHAALLPVYLKAYYRDNGLMKYTRSVLVIHNISYQGRGPMEDVNLVDLPDHYHDIFRVWDPVGGEHLNIFAAGLKCAERIVTVSNGYLWELKTSEGGWGLHDIINENSWKLHGIVNGINTDEWGPELDVHLKSDGYTNYTLDYFRYGKSQCKAALQKELGLPVRQEVPVVGFIGRLDHQKGVDLIAEAIPWMVGQDMQLIMLGSGRPDLEKFLRRSEGQYHDKVRGWVGFSVKTAHRIIAGSDILLMPSRFEPCGLNQLYAMKFGTIPVVHAVGGLRDTVQQFDPFSETGTGWTFDRAGANKIIEALGHCFNSYWNYKKSWEGLQRRGMSQDLSWDNAAQRYEDVLIKAKYQW